MNLLLKNGKSINVSYLAGTNGITYNYAIRHGKKTFVQAFSVVEFINSVIHINIGLNIGNEEPAGQYVETCIFVQDVIRTLKAKHSVMYSEERLYLSSYEGVPERTLAIRIVLNTHALSYITDLLTMLQQGCKRLNQGCIALKVGESGALVYANYIDTTNFNSQYFKQF